MREPIYLLVLGIDKRRIDSVPTPVSRKTWKVKALPDRVEFYRSVEEAYASIQAPYLPSEAWIEIVQDRGSQIVNATKPEDRAMVASELWTAVMAAKSGLG